jgi:phosphoribosyl 1,2-cyclic phosphodiesterase
MHLQVLSSGSKGNSTLVRCGECSVLVDAGLARTEMERRLELARLGLGGLDHVVVTHGHLDHARSAGILARSHRVPVHCAEGIQRNAAVRRSKRMVTLSPARPTELADRRGNTVLSVKAVAIPHDADPTFGLRLEAADGAVAVILTDMGRPVPAVARELAGAQLLVLESNYDPAMLQRGPYPPALQRRIAGGRGHLSNDQAAEMLRLLAGPELHTVVLAHLSEQNNDPALAERTARAALLGLGRGDVEVLVAAQHVPLPNLAVARPDPPA